MQANWGGRWRVISRSEVMGALRVLVGSLGNDPQQYALHAGTIGGATHLARCGPTAIQIQRTGRRKSTAFMVYVRAGEKARSSCPGQSLGTPGWPPELIDIASGWPNVVDMPRSDRRGH